ncbi:hypothetical protein [Bradyrhizobium sp. 76]|uniref:hypothetical protein n=1 Tax=Bradyrhizobium sp. 76 TaxID=2782680 RepID=UPI001FFBA7C4|nr:hypothetical protein [Bradyrhizobium sp. 76]MCK1405195.1 hypothetical protein [Bradyrhizobium sp. 76]
MDACGGAVGNDEMNVKLGRQIGFDVPLQKGTQLLVIARSVIFSNRTPCLFEGGGTPEVAAHSWIPARQEPSLPNQVNALRARLLASRWKRMTMSPA